MLAALASLSLVLASIAGMFECTHVAVLSFRWTMWPSRIRACKPPRPPPLKRAGSRCSHHDRLVARAQLRRDQVRTRRRPRMIRFTGDLSPGQEDAGPLWLVTAGWS